jgi:hypothetical protein
MNRAVWRYFYEVAVNVSMDKDGFHVEKNENHRDADKLTDTGASVVPCRRGLPLAREPTN